MQDRQSPACLIAHLEHKSTGTWSWRGKTTLALVALALSATSCGSGRKQYNLSPGESVTLRTASGEAIADVAFEVEVPVGAVSGDLLWRISNLSPDSLTLKLEYYTLLGRSGSPTTFMLALKPPSEPEGEEIRKELARKRGLVMDANSGTLRLAGKKSWTQRAGNTSFGSGHRARLLWYGMKQRG
jgi:hypothetical protein